MNDIVRWLEKEATEFESLKLLINSIAIIFFWNMFAHWCLSAIEVTLPEIVSEDEMRQQMPLLMILVIPCAFIEEIISRLPLSLFARIFHSQTGTVLFAVPVSLGFGLFHGGLANILLQGVSGLIFCGLFLKCGGMVGKIAKPLFVTTVEHSLFNLILLGLAIAALEIQNVPLKKL